MGCEPHGDHWHCDGPKETTSGATNGTATTGAGTTTPTGAAAGLSAGLGMALLGAAMAL